MSSHGYFDGLDKNSKTSLNYRTKKKTNNCANCEMIYFGIFFRIMKHCKTYRTVVLHYFFRYSITRYFRINNFTNSFRIMANYSFKSHWLAGKKRGKKVDEINQLLEWKIICIQFSTKNQIDLWLHLTNNQNVSKL